jgi:hypothetical protein
MKRPQSLVLIVILLCCWSFSCIPSNLVSPLYGQAWSGILKPTSGTGACTFGSVSVTPQCAIDWTQVGIPGGIPTNWTQSGSTINTVAGSCDSTHDCTSTIQAALSACAGTGLPGEYVQLGTGAFLINGNLSLSNYCYLNGNGPQNTALLARNTGGSPIIMGSENDAPYKNGSCQITSGATAGSTSLILPANSIGPYGCSVATGGFLVISELNDPVYVSSASPQNTGGCGYCDAIWSGTRLREQIVQVTQVTGSGPYTVTINPPLYSNYGVATGTSPAYATPFGVLSGGSPDCIYCGVQNLQVQAAGTNLASGTDEINMTECAFCFVQNVEVNYTDGNWLDAAYCYRCEIRNNYFFNGYGHGAGGTDNFVGLNEETSASLVVNNIMERGHTNVEVDWGAAGNVIAYNYSTGAVDAVATNVNELDLNQHGAYPQFNLWEGNVASNWQPDSWHGNEGYNTVFRNWFRGSTTIATYPQASITSGSCSGGTCTINWASGTSPFYAGTYISIFGTNQVNCGTGNLSTPWKGAVWQLTGTSGQLSSTFSAGSCTSWTGGFAFTDDLASYPTPITHTGAGALSWSSTYKTYQGMWGITIPAFSLGNDLIGNVLGSSDQTATVGSGNMYDSGSGACTSCIRAPTSRPYSGEGFASTYNYDTSGDSSGSDWSTFPGGPSNTDGYWSNQGFTTTFYHGNYDSASASTIWNVNGSGSQSLPASFFLSSKPSWFGSVPWPPIGPDVSGGPDSTVGGHANYIPAEVCYNSLSRDSTGALLFDANSCYAQAPNPPTNLSAVGH